MILAKYILYIIYLNTKVLKVNFMSSQNLKFYKSDDYGWIKIFGWQPLKYVIIYTVIGTAGKNAYQN